MQPVGCLPPQVKFEVVSACPRRISSSSLSQSSCRNDVHNRMIEKVLKEFENSTVCAQLIYISSGAEKLAYILHVCPSAI